MNNLCLWDQIASNCPTLCPGDSHVPVQIFTPGSNIICNVTAEIGDLKIVNGHESGQGQRIKMHELTMYRDNV